MFVYFILRICVIENKCLYVTIIFHQVTVAQLVAHSFSIVRFSEGTCLLTPDKVDHLNFGLDLKWPFENRTMRQPDVFGQFVRYSGAYCTYENLIGRLAWGPLTFVYHSLA